MQKQSSVEEIYAHHDADSIIFSVLHPACKCDPECAIWFIKDLLQDENFSSPHSKRVKAILVEKLSEYLQKNTLSRTTRQSSPYSQKAKLTRTPKYCDTMSLLGESYNTILPIKQSLYWHQLTFENFITAYCHARLQLNPKKSHPLLKNGAQKDITLPVDPI
jgi:hypothetical protein